MRNVEVFWLLCGQQPNYHSIADFRKDNPKALKNTFKLFVLFLKECELIGGRTVAIDGTKVRASNSKKNNYNQKKIDRHLAYIEEKTTEYLKQLEENDKQNTGLDVKHVQAKIERLAGAKIKYETLEKQLSTTDEPQVSTTDTDARALLVQGQVVEVSYNLQAAVDEQHKLVVATHTLNRNDRNALSRAAQEAKDNIQAEAITVIADKGYHNGRELQTTQDSGIGTIVAMAELVNSNDHGTQPEYIVSKFTYHKETDTYTCPEGQTLATKGTWHQKKRDHNISYNFKKYRTPACTSCPVKNKCTGRQDGRREIERSEYAEAVEKNNENYKNNQPLYRKRQEINEHVFGTIKRQWGYNHTNLRGLEKVNGEMALIMTVYNLKRSLNILTMPKILEKLKNWTPDYERVACFVEKGLILKSYKPSKNFTWHIAA
ncbi:IS1182 family transposase [Lacihabitans soyangensis]|uniref:IS1182 family transposase n=1 Tax=Lacihabitans soyangensis TaxID=869394 RepID=A0AAE3KTZ2_9BACT|nr:IS1182 family transposase [Lacihabitans soyangensis]